MKALQDFFCDNYIPIFFAYIPSNFHPKTLQCKTNCVVDPFFTHPVCCCCIVNLFRKFVNESFSIRLSTQGCDLKGLET